MKAETRKIGKDTLIYGIGNALNKLLGFILIPVYTSYISLNDFGVLAVMETSVLFLVQLLHLGIINGHQRYFFLRKEDNTYPSFLFSNYIGTIAFTSILILPFFFLNGFISQILFDTVDYNRLIILTLAIIFFEVVNIIPFQILQFENKPIAYIAQSFAKLLISLFVTLVLVIHYKLGIEGILWGRLAGLLLLAVYQNVAVILKRIDWKFSFSELKISIGYGFPIIFSSIGYLIFNFSDVYMLNELGTKADVGMYSFGFKIANFVNLIFIQSIGLSYFPSVFANENEKNSTQYYSKMLLLYVYLISFVVFLFLVSYEDVLLLIIMNKEYAFGLIIVPIISVGFMIKGMNYFSSAGVYLKKSNFLIWSSFSSAALNIILNLFLIPKYGFLAAAISTLISQIVNTILITYFSNKVLYVSYQWGKIFGVLFILVVGIFINESLNLGFLSNYLIRFLMILLFVASIYFVVMSKEERILIIEGLNKVKKRFS